MLCRDFKARNPISIRKPPVDALREFSHAVATVHPLPISLCLFLSSLWVYLCSCMHIMSMLWSIADALSSGSCPILFQVLTLNDAICIVRLLFSNIYIYIYNIMWVLVVSKSLCGYLSNQVQYNMESAQYLW